MEQPDFTMLGKKELLEIIEQAGGTVLTFTEIHL